MFIENQAFGLLKNTMNKERYIEIPAQGNSMFPFIRQGDVCRFFPCTTFKKGDVVLFCSTEGRLIAHRIVRIQVNHNQLLFYLKGDTNLGFDKPINEERILGTLVSVQKKHFQLSSGHFLAKAWGKMILSFPALSGILQRYLLERLKLT